MSPRAGISTLITSAPIQARSWVPVGPAWTWLRSRTRTPSRALLIRTSLQLGPISGISEVYGVPDGPATRFCPHGAAGARDWQLSLFSLELMVADRARHRQRFR